MIVLLMLASGASFAGELMGIRLGITDFFVLLLLPPGAGDSCDLCCAPPVLAALRATL